MLKTKVLLPGLWTQQWCIWIQVAPSLVIKEIINHQLCTTHDYKFSEILNFMWIHVSFEWSSTLGTFMLSKSFGVTSSCLFKVVRKTSVFKISWQAPLLVSGDITKQYHWFDAWWIFCDGRSEQIMLWPADLTYIWWILRWSKRRSSYYHDLYPKGGATCIFSTWYAALTGSSFGTFYQ